MQELMNSSAGQEAADIERRPRELEPESAMEIRFPGFGAPPQFTGTLMKSIRLVFAIAGCSLFAIAPAIVTAALNCYAAFVGVSVSFRVKPFSSTVSRSRVHSSFEDGAWLSGFFLPRVSSLLRGASESFKQTLAKARRFPQARRLRRNSAIRPNSSAIGGIGAAPPENS